MLREFKNIRLVIIIVFSLIIISCASKSENIRISGVALGAPMNIIHDSKIPNNDLKIEIDKLLIKINQSMSTYQIDSDISRINTGLEVQVDSFFKDVFTKSSEVWRLTNGAFDPTVGALVNAYGFGPSQDFINELTKIQIDSLLQITGWKKIHLNSEGYLIKSNKNISIDFNSIAKGYTVDMIARYLEEVGAKNFLVEIGGEILAKGISSKSKKPWKIGIDFPESNLSKRSNFTTYILDNKSIATSGNYRHFRIDNITGNKYVHTIDPRSGLSVQSKILSASVVASNCMTADAWATSLMVLSLDEGKELIENNKDLEAFWIIADKGELNSVYSSGWMN